MNEFFISIYSWFCDSSQYLFKIMNDIWGEEEQLLLSSSFPTIGVTTAVISFLVAVAFYIWPINHPRFKAWWAWLIMLFVNAAINFGLAFAFIHHRIGVIEENQNIMDSIEETETFRDIVSDEGILTIPSPNWFDFAFSNLCVSIIFFIIASLIFNWFSINCRFSPFRK